MLATKLAPSGRGWLEPGLRSLGQGVAGTRSPLPRAGGGWNQVSAPSGRGLAAKFDFNSCDSSFCIAQDTEGHAQQLYVENHSREN